MIEPYVSQECHGEWHDDCGFDENGCTCGCHRIDDEEEA